MKTALYKKTPLIICIFLALLSVNTAYAYDELYIEKCPPDTGVASDECRDDLIAVTLLFSQEALQAIPSLSPTEQDWLNTEMQSGNAERGLKAVGSNEFTYQHAREKMLEIKALANDLSKSTDKSDLEATALWAKIMSRMEGIDPHDLNKLKRSGISTKFSEHLAPACNKNSNTDTDNQSSFGHCFHYDLNSFYSNIILNNIIIPDTEKNIEDYVYEVRIPSYEPP